MRKAVKQIAACAVLLILFCVICRLTLFRSYTAYIPLHGEEGEAFHQLRVEVAQPEVLRASEPEVMDGYLRVRLQPQRRGDTDLTFRAGNTEILYVMRVTPFHTVVDLVTGGFTGDSAVLIAVTLFWLLISAIMFWHFSRAKGTAFYAYSTIYYAGFFLFGLVTGLVMLLVTVSHLISPASFSMISAYSAINSASTQFMQLTAPFMIFFALAMVVSNAVLLRHERLGFQNVLGLAAGLILLAGEALGWYLFSRDFSGSEWEGRVQNTLQNTYATVFVYFECMLTGSAICALKAARHVPAPNQDFIIILGCWFRKDGSLPPLLRGRVDRALTFWEKQKKETGLTATFIPSGGQGQDEPMPEAEAIRKYLLAHQIPEGMIRPESRSRNTYQNMMFSKEIIENQKHPAKTVFVTTNYHVFRSGVWAAEAGLAAEGVGEKTRWWFWPNAFLRETAGLLVKRWKQELLFLILMIGFFSLLSLTVG